MSQMDRHAELAAESLDEPFRSKALRCFFLVRAHFQDDKQISVVLRDGWRDSKAQWELFKRGRTLNPRTNLWEVTTPREVVTRATPNLGPHCYRRAVHVVLLDTKLTETRNDDTWLADKDPRWKAVGEKAAIVGLVWGGSWQDFAHIEDRDWKAFAKNRDYRPLVEGERCSTSQFQSL